MCGRRHLRCHKVRHRNRSQNLRNMALEAKELAAEPQKLEYDLFKGNWSVVRHNPRPDSRTAIDSGTTRNGCHGYI
jgi:hypothetical protein